MVCSFLAYIMVLTKVQTLPAYGTKRGITSDDEVKWMGKEAGMAYSNPTAVHSVR